MTILISLMKIHGNGLLVGSVPEFLGRGRRGEEGEGRKKVKSRDIISLFFNAFNV